MATRFNLGDIAVDVVLKDIRNIHLGVYPPAGHVRISAPSRMDLDTIRMFVISRLDWIRRQQRKLREQERETPREFLDRESHYVWGKRYLLRIVERERAPSITLTPSRMILSVRPGTAVAERQDFIARWYREQIRAALPALLAVWEPRLGVRVNGIFIQQMKTKWGSCNSRAGTVRLNTEIAKKPNECLEYVLLHEMVHLVEPTHNAHFIALIDRFMPRWQLLRQRLNRLPVRHEDWIY